jgi:hypothetical protein
MYMLQLQSSILLVLRIMFETPLCVMLSIYMFLVYIRPHFVIMVLDISVGSYCVSRTIRPHFVK